MTLILLAGCQWGNPPIVSKAVEKVDPKLPPHVDADTLPLLEFWDNGNYLAGKAPNLLFVIWEDGRVVRQLGNGRLYSGYISQNAVNQFVERISVSGALDPDIKVGVVFPDGGSQLLWIKMADREVSLRHDTSVTWDYIQRVPLAATPSRRQLETFSQMWSRVLAAVDDAWPPQLVQIMGVPGLQYPGAQ